MIVIAGNQVCGCMQVDGHMPTDEDLLEYKVGHVCSTLTHLGQKVRA